MYRTEVPAHCGGRLTVLPFHVTLRMSGIFKVWVCWCSLRGCICLCELQSHGDFTHCTAFYHRGRSRASIRPRAHRGDEEDPYKLMMNVIVCNRDVQPMAAECHRQLMSPPCCVCLPPSGFQQALTNGVVVKDINCGWHGVWSAQLHSAHHCGVCADLRGVCVFWMYQENVHR